MSAGSDDSQLDIDNLLERLLEGLPIIIFVGATLIIGFFSF
jgi:hypothetical protein